MTNSIPSPSSDSVRIEYRGLPSKFKGEGENPAIWVKIFQRHANLHAWADSTSKEVLLTWLEGAASEWQYDLETDPETSDIVAKWTFHHWISELQVRFQVPKPAKPIFNLFGLASLQPDTNESLESFHVKFQNYLNKIPKALYTNEGIKDIYLNILSRINNTVWWTILQKSQVDKSLSLQNLWTEALKLINLQSKVVVGQLNPSIGQLENMANANQFHGTPSAQSPISHGSNFEPVQQSGLKKTDMDMLMEKFDALVLAINKPKDKDSNELTCFSCGRKGHTSASYKCHSHSKHMCNPMCPSYISNNPATGTNAIPIGGKTMFCSEKEETANVLATKRVRIEEMLNEYEKPPIIKKQVLIPSSIKPVKKKGSRKFYEDSIIANRMLDESANITYRELFLSNPKILQRVIQTLQKEKKFTKGSVLNINAEDKLSFISCTINNHPVIVQLDNGSSYSIVTKDFVRKFAVTIMELKAPIKLSPITGKSFEIREYVTLPLTFSEEFMLSVTFLVMDVPASCEILIGIDTLQLLNSVCDYGNQTVTFNKDGEEFQTQLFSKSMMTEQFEEDQYSEEDTDEEDEEDIDLHDPKGEVNHCFMLTPEEVSNKVAETPLLEGQKEELAVIIMESKDLFASTLVDIPGIKDFEFDLDLSGEKPVSSRLRRYSPKEREVIKTE